MNRMCVKMSICCAVIHTNSLFNDGVTFLRITTYSKTLENRAIFLQELIKLTNSLSTTDPVSSQQL